MRRKQPSRRHAVIGISVAAFCFLVVSVVVPLSGVTSPVLVDSRVFGAVGEQRATSVAFTGGRIHLAHNNGSAGVVQLYAPTQGLPLAGGAGIGFTSVAGITPAPSGGTIAVGNCIPPTCGAQDNVGIETKIGIFGFNAAGNMLFAKSANIFAYRGTESLVAVDTAIEGGNPFYYAVGYGEPCQFALNIFAKFDGSGNLISRATEPGLEPDFTTSCAVQGPFGSAAADDLVVTTNGVYVAGASASRPGEDGVLRPVILRYDTSLNRLWKQRYIDVAGQLLAITEDNGALYAAGYANVGGSQQFLIQKYDFNGTRLWSQTSGGSGSDVLHDIMMLNGRLFAVGRSNSPGTDSFDGMLTEYDPVNGSVLTGTAFGGPLDQSLNGLTTDGIDLYVAGESRVAANGNEAVLLRYSISGPSPTTTTVTAAPSPSVYGQNVTFTAAVSGATAVSQGTVTFRESGVIVSGPTNLDASGKASYSSSSLSASPHQITAEYSGHAAFAASAGSITHTITKAGSLIALASSANPSVSGQGITLTATVTPVAPGGGTPAGLVQFRDGGINIGDAVSLTSGVASIQTPLGVGNHSITADYLGDQGFNPSTTNLAQTINRGDTSTIVTTAPNPSLAGQGVTFTATVTAKPPAVGVPTGSVQFKDNGSPFGGPTPVNFGVATSFPFNLGVGSHAITAEFSGDFNFNPSIGGATHVVNKADTTTTLFSSPNPSNATNSIFFSAHVSAAAGSVNEGSVTIREGAAVIAGPFFVDGGGNANFNVSTLSAGTHALVAEYSGSLNFNASNSATHTHVVNALTPFININTGFFTYDGNPHPASATVSGQNGAFVNGTVSLTYSPGGASEPVNAGDYGVTATFTSADPNYANVVVSTGANQFVRINKRQPQLSVIGGAFPYDGLQHPASAVATGIGGSPVSGTFAISYSPGGGVVPRLPGFYGVNATFTSADSNYQSGGMAFGNIQINRPAAIVSVPADITVEAHAGQDSAQVSFVVTAHDVDGSLTPNCSPGSGSFFNSGTTTVTCRAQGVNSSQGFASFEVTVTEPTLESIAVRTADGESSASINVNATTQFVATATFSNGETLSTAGEPGNGGSGGGSDPGGSGPGGGGSAAGAGFWNIHFAPGLDVSACGGSGGGPSFSSQSISVGPNGVINNTQWSPGTPSVNVTGQLTPNVQVTLTLSCIDDPAITTTANLPWQTTSFDGSITFGGHTTNAHVTGWSSQPSLPTAAFASGAATVGDTLYVVGGSVNGAPSGLVQAFDLISRTWSSLEPMSPREGPGVAALNGRLYAAGGRTTGGAATNTLQRFDPASNAWVMLSPMSTARAGLQLVAANGKLYAVGGGAADGTPLNTVEQYDPVADQWIAGAPMSSARMSFAAGALNNGMTIIAAGGGGSSVELYDIGTNTWSSGSPLQASMAAGVTIANRFYVATQCGSFVYRPAAGAVTEGWAIMPGMLNPRAAFAVAAGGDVMFAAGGFTGSNPPSALAAFDALSTPAPGDLFYNEAGAGMPCSGSGGGGDDDDDGEGPAWRIVDPVTHLPSPVATIDAQGLATGITPGTVLVVAEFGGVSCLDSNGCATLTVLDSEPPTIMAPPDVIVEATSADGAIADPGQATATDNLGPVSITRSPQGNQFALGTTTITWRATDGGGNVAEATQLVRVVDTTRPALSIPGNISVDATSPQGATVVYSASATDSVDGSVPVICSKPSGSVLPIGTTTVSCTATDASGNSTSGSFTVLVQAAAAQVGQLIVTVQNFNLQQGISNSLDAKLQNVLEALNGATTGNSVAVCNQLGAFINETMAQSGKKLTVAQANQLIATAQQIQAVIGCQ